jgi:predicted nucleotidyltransferase
MVAMADIQELSNRIAREFRPERIILFGSHAYGEPSEDSDVDLLVIMPHEGSPARMATEIRSRLDASFPIDLIVRDPGELQRRIAWHDWFLIDIVEKGKTLYESAHR